MTAKRKRYTAAFKSKIALEAIRETKTINELAQEHSIHPGQINKWKKEALENFSNLFAQENSSKSKSDSKQLEQLERKVGQLVIENDFLRKNWEGWTSKKDRK